MKVPEEITVTTDDGELIASISLKDGNAIVKDGYKVIEYDEAERK
ncbi:hypothetical protein ABZ756_07005 [Mammaliicoccus sciuri]